MAVAMASDARRGDGELTARLDRLREAVRDNTGGGLVPSAEHDGAHGPAEAIAELLHICLGRLRTVPAADIASAERLCALILELQRLATDHYLNDTAGRGDRLAECAAALSRLRAIPDTAALLGSACEQIVTRCGFERVVLSWVQGGTWRPALGHFAAERDSAWFASWRNERIPLDSPAPEGRLMTQRRPVLVADTANTPVYRPIIVDAGRSRSYVVAPIVQGGDVVGLLHADHHQADRRADEIDRDVLWAFTDGLGYIYERTVLLERLHRQRDQMRELLAAAVDRMDDLCESGFDPTPEHPGPAAYGGTETLTEREAEVFRLMVSGATNRAISEQLVITEGTVKSHVKHILRKFGAANRAQAIAWSLRTER
ncbi:LuxR C-terminal-related transcriptional regulator [Nocardia sp. alder85J]|uniref:LuxR C-terminal-related transcriptional regulator n=1 Tax=Nocardia sp. alder85J TaxID=2862949 RepID=UPI001CD6A907|nr:LuxR C-terminal-related transcriptional regulator [Nocardia sp. alder85J]MCX4094452.1 LuxR C-terminal-related transcriptional regulator [Nocardia sp. alder85J]